MIFLHMDAKPNQWGGIWLLPRVCLGLLQDYYSSPAKSKKKRTKIIKEQKKKTKQKKRNRGHWY